MGDRSYLNLWIYEIPERKVRYVYKVLEEYGISCDMTHWDEKVQNYVTHPMTVEDMTDAVVNAADFYNEECNLGTAEEVHRRLCDLGVAHQIHQDPRYEYPGSLYRFHPKIGAWEARAADAETNAYLTDWEYRRLEEKAKESEEPFEIALLDLVGEHLGIAYEDDFRHLTGQLSLSGRV